MTTKEEIREKLEELVSLSQELDLYFKQNEQPEQYGLWKPKVGGRFYFINYVGHIECEVYLAESPQDFYISIGNCFKTKEDAEKHLEHLKVETQLRDIAARLNKGTNIDWNNFKEQKWYLIYSYPQNTILKDFADTVKLQGDVYCLDENFKDAAIAEIGEERLKDYLKEC